MRKIFDSLACSPEVERAILFGSRATQTHNPGSDVDLAAHIMRVDIPIYHRDRVTAHARQVDGLDTDSPQSRARRVKGSGTSLR